MLFNITFIVTGVVISVLGMFYLIFNNEVKQEKNNERKKKELLRKYLKDAISNIKVSAEVGTGEDYNSDYRFISAVEEISLSDDIRVRIHD